jgi:hypothetical protein
MRVTVELNWTAVARTVPDNTVMSRAACLSLLVRQRFDDVVAGGVCHADSQRGTDQRKQHRRTVSASSAFRMNQRVPPKALRMPTPVKWVWGLHNAPTDSGRITRDSYTAGQSRSALARATDNNE